MDESPNTLAVDYPEVIVNMMTLGVIMLDRRFTIVLWNRFMELNSNMRTEEVLGKNIFEVFPEINRNWLEKKVKSCMVLQTPSFSSWRQRPYLLRFKASPTTASVAEFMYQDISIFPLHAKEGVVQGACLAIHDMTELAESTRLLEQAMEHAVELEDSNQRDGLTGLYTRRFMEEQITQEVSRAKRYSWPLAFAMIDIDHFKDINDTYGHPEGDVVLRALASRMQGMLRSSDTLCRYGGEEFGLIVPNISREHSGFMFERLRKSVANMDVQTSDGRRIGITISIGVAHFDESITSGELIRRADEALYASKEAGRNRVTFAAAK